MFVVINQCHLLANQTNQSDVPYSLTNFVLQNPTLSDCRITNLQNICAGKQNKWSLFIISFKPNVPVNHETPKINLSFKTNLIGTDYENLTYSKPQTNLLDILNGCLYSILTLYVLYHMAILILTVVFVSLNLCFNTSRKQSIKSSRKKALLYCNVSSIFDCLQLITDHSYGNLIFNGMMIIIIVVPYTIGICYCFRDKVKQMFDINYDQLKVLIQSVYEKWLTCDIKLNVLVLLKPGKSFK